MRAERGNGIGTRTFHPGDFVVVGRPPVHRQLTAAGRRPTSRSSCGTDRAVLPNTPTSASDSRANGSGCRGCPSQIAPATARTKLCRFRVDMHGQSARLHNFVLPHANPDRNCRNSAYRLQDSNLGPTDFEVVGGAASDFSPCPPARVTSQPSPRSASNAAPYASSLAGPIPGTCRSPWRSRGRTAASSASVRSWKMT
jgi:hypothetical protein